MANSTSDNKKHGGHRDPGSVNGMLKDVVYIGQGHLLKSTSYTTNHQKLISNHMCHYV